MDSITQFVLGAAIGEVVAGKKAGNKALFWGGVAGTIPDLDIVFRPFFTELQNLAVHRGISHSLIFAFITAPLVAWLVNKMYRKKTDVTYKEWLNLFFWGIFTHPLLDAFTLYGTQLFLPFSNYRVAFNTISIIDPLYTVPLIVVCIGAMIVRRKGHLKARKWAMAGLHISSAYLALTCLHKWYLESIFDKGLASRQIHPVTVMSNPVIFSNFLWCSVARDDSACYIGYYSILQGNTHVEYEKFLKQEELSSVIADKEGFNTLKWFTKDYYILEERNDTLCFFDVRYGKSTFSKTTGNEQTFVFYFKIPHPGQSPLDIVQYISRKDMDLAKFFSQLKHRIFHEN